MSASVPEYGEEDVPYGIWGRVTDALLEKPYMDRLGHHPVEMVTSDGELWVGRSVEHAYAYEISLRGKTLRILAPIHKAPPGVPFSEFGWYFGGDLCRPDGPFAAYELTELDPELLAGEIRLTAKKEPCEKRRALLEGPWEGLD